jgi:hypothetical protein
VNLRPLRDLPPALVSSGHVAAIEQLLHRFASPVGVLIECPLGDAPPAADVSVQFARPASRRETSLVSNGWPAGTAWDGVRRFVEVWGDPAGPLWNDVRTLWLEFDASRHADAPASAPPNPFFGDSAGLRSRAAIRAGLDLLLGPSVPEQPLASSGLDEAPVSAPVLFVGVMLARRPSRTRFCIDALPWQAAPADLVHLARRVIVQIEAGGPNASRVGFELYQGLRQRGRSDVWRPLLDRLHELGMATSARNAAALEWPGYAYDAAAGAVVRRWINHVKITCEAGVVVGAKVYLQYGMAWKPKASDLGGLANLSL